MKNIISLSVYSRFIKLVISCVAIVKSESILSRLSVVFLIFWLSISKTGITCSEISLVLCNSSNDFFNLDVVF